MFKLIPTLFITVLCYAQGAAQPLDPSHKIPVAKGLTGEWEQSLWKNEKIAYRGNALKTIGMPCGGIGAGQLCVRGDGTLGDWWISNNAYNTGYGIDSLMHFNTPLGPWKVCYQSFEPMSYVDQGFKLAVKQSGKTITKSLDKKGFDNISFTGEYPIANINYASTADPLPVAVSMEVYSPFIPLNARESATPGTILKFTIRNNSKVSTDIRLTGWLQNLVCLELADKSISGTCRNEVITGNGMTSVNMSLVKTSLQQHPYYGNISLNLLSDNSSADADYQDSKDHMASVVAERKLGDKLVGSCSTAFLLEPGQVKEITFLLTWFFPNRPAPTTDLDWNTAITTTGPVIGNMYANWFNSSRDVATYLQKNLARLSAQTHLFHDTYYNETSLPYWLNQRLMMPVSTLATETSQWWANDRFWAWEGVGSCYGTCTHVWNYEQAMAHLFPDLERNVREKTDFGTSFGADGGIQSRNGWGGVLIDGHAGAILKAYREYLNSSNSLFLSRNWARIKMAMEYMILQDENEDGLIEKEQSNTYDIAFSGANTYVGGLYLAALKAASAMASLMNDTAFGSKCDSIFKKGEANTIKRIWNGEYFFQEVDLKKYPQSQYATGCLSDQLFGQTWAHLNNTGYIYPEDKVKSALQSIWKYNWAKDIGPQTNAHKPERVYADPGEAGLLICTWPHSQHMGDSGVRYRDEVWTGIEYQVATNMIYEGMTKEGLSLIKAVQDRYSPEKHNPWNEIECGDHYARALASWGVLLALEDFYFNGPEKIIGFSPKIQQTNFKGFFSAAECWGTLQQQRKQGQQINSLDIVYGKLVVKTIQTQLTKTPQTVEVFTGNKKLPCSFTISNNQLTVILEKEITLEEKNKLKLVASL